MTCSCRVGAVRMLPAACVQRLNAFCNEACPLSKSHGPLVALLGASAKSTAFAWRCYAPSTLDADGQYRSGTEYCTRHDALTTLLDGPVCKSTPQLVEVTALGEASAPVEDKLKTPTTLPPALLQPWPGGADEEVTVAAVDATLWHPTPEKELLEVRAWHVPCIDSLKLHNLNNRTRNVSRRKAFLSRKGLACFDASRCVRGVVDGFATADEVAQMRTLAPRPTKNNPANIEMWRWAVPKQPSVFRELVARAQAVLYEKFGIARTRFYRSNIITWHAPQCTEGRESCAEEWPATSHPWWPASLHGDTNTDEMVRACHRALAMSQARLPRPARRSPCPAPMLGCLLECLPRPHTPTSYPWH